MMFASTSRVFFLTVSESGDLFNCGCASVVIQYNVSYLALYYYVSINLFSIPLSLFAFILLLSVIDCPALFRESATVCLSNGVT